MSLINFRRNLSFIASQPVDTAICTSDGKQFKTQRVLLSAVSPYLAALISQVPHTDMVAISVPFSSETIVDVLDILTTVEDEEFSDIQNCELITAVRELRIKFLMKKFKNKKRIKNVKKETDKDDSGICNIDLIDVSYDELKTDNLFQRKSLNRWPVKKARRKHKNGDDDLDEQKCNICNFSQVITTPPSPVKQPSHDPAHDPSHDPAHDPSHDPAYDSAHDPSHDPVPDPRASTPLEMSHTSSPSVVNISSSHSPTLSDQQDAATTTPRGKHDLENSSLTRALDIMKDVADNMKRGMLSRLSGRWELEMNLDAALDY